MSILLIIIILAIAILAYGSANIKSGILVNAVCHTPDSRLSSSPVKNENDLLLTFDDGPDPLLTPRVLDTLDRHNRRAIFFLIGEKVDKYPDLVKQIVQRGHAIGNHTYHHDPLNNFRGAKHFQQEITLCSDAIQRACGQRPTLFRPPIGITTHFTRPLMKKLNLTCVGWSIRSFDTRQESRDKVFRRVKHQLKPGAIILLHDRMQEADTLAERILSAWENMKEKNIS